MLMKRQRGRPKMKPGFAKTVVLTCRLTQEEMDQLNAAAAKEKVAVSDFARGKLLAKPKRERIEWHVHDGDEMVLISTPSPLSEKAWKMIVEYAKTVLKPPEV